MAPTGRGLRATTRVHCASGQSGGCRQTCLCVFWKNNIAFLRAEKSAETDHQTIAAAVRFEDIDLIQDETEAGASQSRAQTRHRTAISQQYACLLAPTVFDGTQGKLKTETPVNLRDSGLGRHEQPSQSTILGHKVTSSNRGRQTDRRPLARSPVACWLAGPERHGKGGYLLAANNSGR